MRRDYDALMESWENIYDEYEMRIEEISKEEFMELIFDTYHYFKEKVGDSDTIRRNCLPLYHCVIRTELCLAREYLEGVSEAESTTFSDILKGLIYVFENGFDIGYGKCPLPMGLRRHTPAGGAEPEADMSTYESFEKSFEANVQMLRDDYDME